MPSNTNTKTTSAPTTSTSSSRKLAPYPNVRRVVTGHSAEGKSIIVRDEVQQPFFWNSKGLTAVTDFYRTSEHPANLDCEVQTGEWVDEIKEDAAMKVSANGTTFRVLDIPPGHFFPMHRNLSLDYGVIASGTLTLILEDGETRLLKEGDVMIQRGTMHGWKNATDEWVRMYCISLASNAIEVNGQYLQPGSLYKQRLLETPALASSSKLGSTRPRAPTIVDARRPQFSNQEGSPAGTQPTALRRGALNFLKLKG